MPGPCDHRVSAVLIKRWVQVLGAERPEYLMIQRATFPFGVAPVAGHVDDHGNYRDAAVAEVREEVGVELDPSGLTLLDIVSLANRCRRPHEFGRLGARHLWAIYHATVPADTEVTPAPDEATRAFWASLGEIRELRGRTVRAAARAPSGVAALLALLASLHEPREVGLEPVWCGLLADDLGLIPSHPLTGLANAWAEEGRDCWGRPAPE